MKHRAKRLVVKVGTNTLTGGEERLSRPQMMGVAIQAYFSNYNQPQAAVALAVMLFAICAVAGVIYVWATGRSNQQAVIV